MEDITHSIQKPWLFEFRSSKQLIGSAVFATTFTDGFLYGIVSAFQSESRDMISIDLMNAC
jgi:hypothetical protein